MRTNTTRLAARLALTLIAALLPATVTTGLASAATPTPARDSAAASHRVLPTTLVSARSTNILSAPPTPRRPRRVGRWGWGVASSVPDGFAFVTVTVKFGRRVVVTQDFERIVTNRMNSMLALFEKTGTYTIYIKGWVGVDTAYGPEPVEYFGGHRSYYVQPR